MSAVGPTLEQALASAEARLSDVLDLVDAAIEQAAAEGDGALLAGLADRLDATASERGGEWGALAIAAARARALAGRSEVPGPGATEAVPTAAVPPVAAPSPPVAAPPPPVAAPPPPATAGPVLVYAGWWRRVLAFLLDAVVIGIALTVWGLVSSGSASFGFILLLAYFAVVPVLTDGVTPGKAALGIAIRLGDGAKMGIGRSLARAVVFGLLWLTGIGALVDATVMATDSRRRSLHDKAADTIVVRTRA